MIFFSRCIRKPGSERLSDLLSHVVNFGPRICIIQDCPRVSCDLSSNGGTGFQTPLWSRVMAAETAMVRSGRESAVLVGS